MAYLIEIPLLPFLGFPHTPFLTVIAPPSPPPGGRGALNPGQGQPPGGGGGDMLTRPVLTPGRAYSVGANARRGGRPLPHRLQYKTLEPAPLRRAGRHTDPPKNSVAAVRAAAMPGRRILNAAGAGQGLGSPASADARPAGGARSRGPLWLPRTKYGPRGGGPAGRTACLFSIHPGRLPAQKKAPKGHQNGYHISPCSA